MKIFPRCASIAPMPAFQYEAVNAAGLRSSGEVEATDRGDAIRKLARRGLQPSSVREAGAAEKKAAPKPHAAERAKSAEKSGGSERIVLKRSQVIQFTEELTDLLTAGLQLDQALHAMENRSSPVLRRLAERMREKVRDGVPFSVALTSTSPSFGELYANLAAAGEASGSLTSILNRQAKYLNSMEALRGKVVTAMIYPAFIIASGILLAVLFTTYLLPKLVVLITSTGSDVPGAVGFMLSMSDFIRHWWWALLLLIVIFIAGIKVFLSDPERRKSWHRAVLSLPVYGPLLRTRFEVQFLETLGNLLAEPRAALLFIDFDNGDVLHIQGTTQIHWQPDEISVPASTERYWTLDITRLWRFRSALP